MNHATWKGYFMRFGIILLFAMGFLACSERPPTQKPTVHTHVFAVCDSSNGSWQVSRTLRTALMAKTEKSLVELELMVYMYECRPGGEREVTNGQFEAGEVVASITDGVDSVYVARLRTENEHLVLVRRIGKGALRGAFLHPWNTHHQLRRSIV